MSRGTIDARLARFRVHDHRTHAEIRPGGVGVSILYRTRYCFLLRIVHFRRLVPRPLVGVRITYKAFYTLTIYEQDVHGCTLRCSTRLLTFSAILTQFLT